MPTLEERLQAFWDVPENRGKVLVWSWRISIGTMVLGYLIMAYILFVAN